MKKVIFIFSILGTPKTVATPKTSADGDGKQGSLRVSKRLSVKGSTPTLHSEHPSATAADEQPEVCRFYAWHNYTYLLVLH
jgi:hypothetical protein